MAERAVIDAAYDTGAIVTAENHSITTGLAAAVSEVVVRHEPVPMEFVGDANAAAVQFRQNRWSGSSTHPAKVKSDSKGIVEFTDLAPGTYYVKETAASNGYLLNTFPLTVVIPDRVPVTLPMTDEQNNLNKIEDGTYVVDAGDFQNARKEISLKKTDGESSGSLDLSKVIFALYIDDGSAAGSRCA